MACYACLRANVVYVPRCLRASVVYVPTCLRANVPKAYQFLIFTCQRASERANVSYDVPMFQLNVPKCQKAYQCFNLACQRAKRRASVSTWGSNVPKGVPIFQTFFLRNAKGNLYSLHYIS